VEGVAPAPGVAPAVEVEAMAAEEGGEEPEVSIPALNPEDPNPALDPGRCDFL